MRIVVAAVGRFGGPRAKSAPARTLFDDYVKRIAFPIALKEIEERRPLSAAALKAREGALLLAAIPKGATVVALDAQGRALTSAEFARRLSGWRDHGVKDLAFVIGGADGLDRHVLDRAQLVLSLGPMTWPHLLARVLLVEQIYRAQCILQGHPYHRE